MKILRRKLLARERTSYGLTVVSPRKYASRMGAELPTWMTYSEYLAIRPVTAK